jgi:hypothetical protein
MAVEVRRAFQRVDIESLRIKHSRGPRQVASCGENQLIVRYFVLADAQRRACDVDRRHLARAKFYAYGGESRR